MGIPRYRNMTTPLSTRGGHTKLPRHAKATQATQALCLGCNYINCKVSIASNPGNPGTFSIAKIAHNPGNPGTFFIAKIAHNPGNPGNPGTFSIAKIAHNPGNPGRKKRRFTLLM